MDIYYFKGNCYPDDGFTQIPEKAVLLPKNHWFLTVDSIPEGKNLSTGANGLPDLVDAIPMTVEKRCSLACAALDTSAGTARASFATNSAFIESEYQRTYQLAVNWIDSGYQGEAPKPVKSHAEAYNVPEQQAAEEIKHTGDLWLYALDEIRDIRLKGKQHIMSLGEDADHMAEAQQFIDQLKALEAG